MSASFCGNDPPIRSVAALERVELADQFRDDLEQVADDPVVGDFEQRRLRVDVDDEDLLRLLHPGEVLDGAADADRDVELGPHRHPGLSDLEGLRDPSAVDGLARRGNRSAEPIRELLQQGEVLRGAEEHDLRLVPPDELRHHLGVRTRSIDLEDRIVHDNHAIEAVADRLLGERVHAVPWEDSGEGCPPQVGEPPPFADQLRAHVAEVPRASLQEDPHPAEVGLILQPMAVRYGTITRSRIRASRRARTVSFGSPEKMWPARAGRRIVSTFATIVGEFSNPTFFGSMPTSAHEQCAMTSARVTRIVPVKGGARGLLHPKFTVQRDGIDVCHHSVPSSAVRRARTVPSTMRISETYVIWGRSRWPAMPGPT